METYIAAALFLVITTLGVCPSGFWCKYREQLPDVVREGYWVNYNIVEALACYEGCSDFARLIWQKEIWELHIVTLLTSALLIWVSERKLLPTMVAFNTLIGLSSVVIVRNLF